MVVEVMMVVIVLVEGTDSRSNQMGGVYRALFACLFVCLFMY